MGKVLKGIDGERFPLIGGIAEYHVTFAETVDVETINDKEILWQVYWANEYSGYEKVPFSGQKTGRLTTYKFLQNLQGKNLQLKATYKNEAVELHITPQANGEIKIIDVFFLDVEYKMLDASNLKYLNSVNLQIYTLNMLGKYVEFKIYDTVNGRDVEVAKSSEPLKIVQTNGIVKTKRAILLSPAMYMQTQQDMSASEHHYKVKVWEKNDETNFYEEELKVKNELGQMSVPKDSQTPVKTGTSEPDKKKEEEKKDEKCFCDRDLTIEDFIKIGISKKNAEKFKDALNLTFTNYNINTCIRKLHFLAQVRHESLEFIYEEEVWGPTPTQSGYEGRKDLCHKLPGDGKRFLGRGLIQITGRCNYTSYSNYKKENGDDIDFTIEPNNKKIGKLPYSVDSAGWYWSKKLGFDLSTYADKDDIIYITYRINGGFNGYIEDRKPKLIKMIKNSVECKNSKYINYEKYSIKNSKCWESQDSIYRYAQLSTDESKISYQQYLDLTSDYLNFSSVKGWEKSPQKKKNKEKIEARREKAKQKVR